MQKDKISIIIQKYLDHTATYSEIEELRRWLDADPAHEALLVKLLRLRHAEEQLSLLDSFDSESSWKALQDRLHPRRSLRRRLISYAAAAVTFLAMGISTYIYIGHQKPASDDATAWVDSLSLEHYADSLRAGSPEATLAVTGYQPVALRYADLNMNRMQVLPGELILPDETPDEPQSADTTVRIDSKLLKSRLQVPRGAEYSLVMGDGTRVKLNADTHLDFPLHFAGTEREVTLKGEAYFEVAHQPERPFRVKCGKHVVTVLGTKFNVSAYVGEPVVVTLVEGSVSVLTDTGREFILKPGMQYQSLTRGVANVETQTFTSWTQGAMEFDAMPMPTLIAKLGRWYNADIVIEGQGLEKLQFTGVLFKDKPLSFAIDILQRVSGVKFEKRGKQIIVRENK